MRNLIRIPAVLVAVVALIVSACSTAAPTAKPSTAASAAASVAASVAASTAASAAPSTALSAAPSTAASTAPSAAASVAASVAPTTASTTTPSVAPSTAASSAPSGSPSGSASGAPSGSASAESCATNGAPTKVSLQLEWVPQAQFAGFYVAQDKGYYADEGLEVDILPGGPNVRGIQQVASGAATFGLDSVLGVYQARDAGLPVVIAGQFDQKDGFVKLAMKSSGIAKPEDFRGKRVGVWPDENEFYPLMKSVNIDPNKDLTLVQQAFTMDDFLNGGLDVASATLWNEYNVVLESGVKPEDLNVINYSDYGFGIPHGALLTTADTLANNRDLAVCFVRASIRGWQDAFNDIEGATDIVMKVVQAGTEQSSREHQKLMLEAMKTLDLPEGFDPANLGKPDPSFYETAAKIATDYTVGQECRSTSRRATTRPSGQTPTSSPIRQAMPSEGR